MKTKAQALLLKVLIYMIFLYCLHDEKSLMNLNWGLFLQKVPLVYKIFTVCETHLQKHWQNNRATLLHLLDLNQQNTKNKSFVTVFEELSTTQDIYM